MKKKRKLVIVLLIIIVFLIIRLFVNENAWVCVNGEWVEKGNPKTEKPKTYCVDGQVNNFKECVGAGNSITGTYPRKCVHENQTYKEVIKNFCLKENTKDVCITLYDPVCGYPINQTFSNSCFACQNKEVVYWVKGECL